MSTRISPSDRSQGGTVYGTLHTGASEIYTLRGLTVMARHRNLALVGLHHSHPSTLSEAGGHRAVAWEQTL